MNTARSTLATKKTKKPCTSLRIALLKRAYARAVLAERPRGAPSPDELRRRGQQRQNKN